MSPNTRWPIVRGASRWTRPSSTSSRVVKLAVLPEPLPTMPSQPVGVVAPEAAAALRSQVPLPSSSRVKTWPAVNPAAELVAGGVRDAGARARSRRAERCPRPDSGADRHVDRRSRWRPRRGQRPGQAAAEDGREVGRVDTAHALGEGHAEGDAAGAAGGGRGLQPVDRQRPAAPRCPPRPRTPGRTGWCRRRSSPAARNAYAPSGSAVAVWSRLQAPPPSAVVVPIDARAGRGSPTRRRPAPRCRSGPGGCRR